jgi:hypothetical protein
MLQFLGVFLANLLRVWLLTLSTAKAGRFLLLRLSSVGCSQPLLGSHIIPFHLRSKGCPDNISIHDIVAFSTVEQAIPSEWQNGHSLDVLYSLFL